jgi:hypothetical protein
MGTGRRGNSAGPRCGAPRYCNRAQTITPLLRRRVTALDEQRSYCASAGDSRIPSGEQESARDRGREWEQRRPLSAAGRFASHAPPGRISPLAWARTTATLSVSRVELREDAGHGASSRPGADGQPLSDAAGDAADGVDHLLGREAIVRERGAPRETPRSASP